MQPSPEQFGEWLDMAIYLFPFEKPADIAGYVARRAYAAGADAQLEVCCEWLEEEGLHGYARQLRAALRPKPKSIREQALEDFDTLMSQILGPGVSSDRADRIRLAIEALPDDPA